MNIVELKTKIENKTLYDSIKIFKYIDTKFICYQYIKAISENKGKEIHYIHSLNDLDEDNSLFEMDNSFLNVLDLNKLSEYPSPNMENIIIICNELPKDLKVDYIEFPKLINWQIEDFVKTRLSGLSDSEISWLCKNAKYDINRLDNECKKLEIFPAASQELIFKQILEENGYCDLNSNSIFNLTEAIIKKDIDTIKDVLLSKDYIDLEPAGLVSILLKNYHKLLIVLSSSYWSDSLEGIVSEKQFRFYKAVYGKQYSITNLIKIYEILSSIDYDLKSGNIDYDMIIDYILIKLLSI